MIYRSFLFCVLSGTMACGQQKTEKNVTPTKAVEVERILGEEDAADPEESNTDRSSGDSEAEVPPTTESGEKEDAKETIVKHPENLDLSKIEELIYKYKDGANFKEIIVKFQANSCSFATEAGIINGSLLQCLALKSALAQLDDIRYAPDTKCSADVERLIVKAGGLEQILSKGPISGAKDCEIPELPADAVKLLDDLLKLAPA